MSDYFDPNTDLYKSKWNDALSYEDYLMTGSEAHRSRWQSFERKIVVSDVDAKILSSFKRKMNVLVLSGIWCGDCARQGPILHKLALESPAIEVKFTDNGKNPDLQDQLRILGAARVPVALVLSEDFFEVKRSSDRMPSVYRRKALTELGPACEWGMAPAEIAPDYMETSEWFGLLEHCQLMLRLAPMLRRRYND